MSRDVITFMCCLLNKSFDTVPSKEITRFACGDYTLRKIVVFSRNQYREISTGKSMNDYPNFQKKKINSIQIYGICDIYNVPL